jgi:hypothetical protein
MEGEKMNKFKLPSTKLEMTVIEYINIHVEYYDEDNEFKILSTSITKHNQFNLIDILQRNGVSGQITNVKVIPIVKQFYPHMGLD